jgi:2-oxoglutarate ferredoxin oxidoreductase subunit beta
LGSRGTFFARSLDVDMKLTQEIIVASAKHSGTAITEILQNCVIFNDQTHAAITDKEFREDRTIILRHGKPMIFGKNNDKGLMLDNFKIKVATLGENGVSENDLLIHDACEPNPGLHMILVNMSPADELPIALGVIRAVKDKTYDDNVIDQINHVCKTAEIKCMDDLLHSGATWEVK